MLDVAELVDEVVDDVSWLEVIELVYKLIVDSLLVVAELVGWVSEEVSDVVLLAEFVGSTELV